MRFSVILAGFSESAGGEAAATNFRTTMQDILHGVKESGSCLQIWRRQAVRETDIPGILEDDCETDAFTPNDPDSVARHMGGIDLMGET